MNDSRKTEILVVGGGAAGLCAANEAAKAGASVLVLDSDLHIGGQLVKQTHKFFGSKHEYAGTRGYEIAKILMRETQAYSDKISVECNTTVTGYYKAENIYTAMKGEESYFSIQTERAIIGTGAQERILPFTNNDLPGVYGAGAVQTLMNLYGVTPGNKVLMVGGGNIGLIVSYQLMQAGVEVVGLVEAMPKIGGYWVHAAKIRRLGVPIYLRHTVTGAIGTKEVEGAMIQPIDEAFRPCGSPQRVDCDVICMAVGLTPSTELFWQGGCDMLFVPQLCGHVPYRDQNMRTSNCRMYVAGDASGIEEASSAMIEGRIAGMSAAKSLGYDVDMDKFEECRLRLKRLRGGPTGEKIRSGLVSVTVDKWGE